MLKSIALQNNTGQNIKRNSAFSLIEILVVMAIIGTLVALSILSASTMLEKARLRKACGDIAVISAKIGSYLSDYEYLPAALEAVDHINLIDPWGNPYQYLIILGKKKNEIEGKWRKDRFLIPINSDFDLYSMGKDGQSRPPLTAKVSHDDIIRANNGGYIGEASKY
jgi:general secretion pathway protein G